MYFYDYTKSDVKCLRLSVCPMFHGRAKRHRCQRFLCFSLAVEAIVWVFDMGLFEVIIPVLERGYAEVVHLRKLVPKQRAV